jgi:hypothetical protein
LSLGRATRPGSVFHGGFHMSIQYESNPSSGFHSPADGLDRRRSIHPLWKTRVDDGLRRRRG